MSKVHANIPIARVDINEQEINAALAPLKSGWLVQGPHVYEFEKKWSEFTGSNFSIAVTSCTTAMQLCLAALEFEPDDEAIVPALTWISTANVVEHQRGKVVFCDVSRNDFNIDVNEIEKKITKNTKVIFAVHLFGFPAEMEKIRQLAKAYNLKIIEDAACGFGTKLSGKHVGNFGEFGCFSFHPRKAITTGEGGMITTNCAEMNDKLRTLRDHGATMSDLQRHHGAKPYLLSEHTSAGFNARMTDFQAALGSAQMLRAEEILQERIRLADHYVQALSGLDWLKLPSQNNPGQHSFQSFACMFKHNEINASNIEEISEQRNKVMEKLQAKGISTRPATHSVHTLAYYKNKYSIKPKDFINAWACSECSISIPLFNGMKTEEQERVIDAIRGLNI